MSFCEREFLETIRATILHFAGANADPEALENTPLRFLNHLEEALSGYSKSPREILSKTFDIDYPYNNFVLLKKSAFASTCEHHLLPIIGQASVAYFPKKKVVGLSKIARLVDMFARRLQLQEKMTSQIGTSMDNFLDNEGVAVYISAQHMCVCSRGVLKPGSEMDTFYFSGRFKEAANQDLFLRSISGGRGKARK